MHLTLSDAFRLALENSTDGAVYRSKIRMAEWQVVQAAAGGRPHFDFKASYIRLEPPFSFSGSGLTFDIVDENNYTYGPVLTQAIATFGRLHYGTLAARLNLQSARNDYRRVVDQLLLQVGTAYDQALQADEGVSIARASVGLKEAHVADTEQRFEAGAVSRYDVIRDGSDLNLARQQLLSAQDSHGKALIQVLTLLGVNPARPVVLVGEGQDTPPPDDKALGLQLALDHRPELQTLNYAWQAAQASARLARSKLNPSVNLSMEYDEANATGFTVGPYFSGTLSLQVPVFDGGEGKADINQSIEQAEQLRQQYEATRRAVLSDVESCWLDLQTAWQRLGLARQNLKETEQLAYLADVRYKNGISTNLERLDAENNLEQVRSTAATALYDYRQARVRWVQATAQDYPAEVVSPTLLPGREQNSPLPPGWTPRVSDQPKPGPTPPPALSPMPAPARVSPKPSSREPVPLPGD
ncbi:MAG TPA: TolC family protein [Candidatus Xenobia bacterium]